MITTLIRLTRVLPLLVLLLPLMAGAEELTGQAIAERAWSRDDGDDSHARVEMTLVDKKGAERKRSVEVTYRDAGGLRESYTEFTSPADIEGTRFLSSENKDGDDTQYLFLPSVGRSRRIVSNQKKASFVNTEFTYEDMQRRSPDKDKHTLLKSETLNGRDCYVMENVPIDPKSSQYTRTITWVDKKSFVIVKVDMFDEKGENHKRYVVNKLEQVSGIWTAMDVSIEHLKEKRKTLMKILEVQYNKGIGDNIFTMQHLERK